VWGETVADKSYGETWEQTERSADFLSVSEIDIVPSVPAFLILNLSCANKSFR